MVLCPHCQSPVAEENLDPSAGGGRCPHCQEPFELQHAALDARHLSLDTPPPGVEVVRNGPDLHVAIQWASRDGLALLALATVLVPLNLYLGTRGPSSMIFLLIGAIAYIGAAFLFNTTLVEVVGHELSVRHAPLPWPGARSVPTTSLRGFRVESRVRRRGRTPITVFDLKLRTRYGDIPFVSGFEDPAVPAYLEALLTDQLTS